MTFLEDLRDGIDRLTVFGELDCETTALVAAAGCLSDASVRDAFSEVVALSRGVKKLEVILAGIIAQRSTRQAGHGGLAQTGGYRTPVQMVQEVAGISRGDAIRAVKVGEALVEGDATAADVDRVESGVPSEPLPWHQPLAAALMSGALTHAQLDAIRRGLGEPPMIEGQADADVIEVWRIAAMQLIDEASGCTVEDLAAAARAARDAIDPVGAEDRWRRHYEGRSFRMRTDADGRHHGHIIFDDPTYAAWQAVFDSALRPRRGGPRFMSDDERAAAEELQSDPRSNEQLAYDLIVDLVGAGAAAEAKDVFGVRQAGVRVVTIQDVGAEHSGGVLPGRRDLFGRLIQVAHTEDGRVTIPGSVLERTVCATGIVPVSLDSCGNPLDVGRESRLFTPAQRIALAARDGGCMWPGCDRPPSMTEAHHIDEWVADEGRTDIDRGLLLCLFHHVHLHMTGMRVAREGKGLFRLIAPPGDDTAPIELHSKSPIRWMFDPPERRPWRAAA